jgi:predicted DNA-binding protein (MmcQ/YjbR family)
MKRKPFARQLQRVRKICLSLLETTEKISHGEPTFFVKKRVFAMFSNNHHGDGHVAVWLPAPPGLQEVLIDEAPNAYYRPPYVGGGGWIGIELDQVPDDALAAHIRQSWQLILKKGRK